MDDDIGLLGVCIGRGGGRGPFLREREADEENEVGGPERLAGRTGLRSASVIMSASSIASSRKGS